jgi:hypothetical protein
VNRVAKMAVIRQVATIPRKARANHERVPSSESSSLKKIDGGGSFFFEVVECAIFPVRSHRWIVARGMGPGAIIWLTCIYFVL